LCEYLAALLHYMKQRGSGVNPINPNCIIAIYSTGHANHYGRRIAASPNFPSEACTIRRFFFLFLTKIKTHQESYFHQAIKLYRRGETFKYTLSFSFSLFLSLYMYIKYIYIVYIYILYIFTQHNIIYSTILCAMKPRIIFIPSSYLTSITHRIHFIIRASRARVTKSTKLHKSSSLRRQ